LNGGFVRYIITGPPTHSVGDPD